MTHALILASPFLAGYALLQIVGCVVFPFTACHRCTGSGKQRSPGGSRIPAVWPVWRQRATSPPRPPDVDPDHPRTPQRQPITAGQAEGPPSLTNRAVSPHPLVPSVRRATRD